MSFVKCRFSRFVPSICLLASPDPFWDMAVRCSAQDKDLWDELRNRWAVPPVLLVLGFRLH